MAVENILPLLTVLFLLCRASAGMQCYDCFPNDQRCNDPLDKSNTRVEMCGVPLNAAPSLMRRVYRNISDDDPRLRRYSSSSSDYQASRNYGFSCIKVTVSGRDVDGAFVHGTIRGCVLNIPNQCGKMSDLIRYSTGGNVQMASCDLCDGDKCNGSTGIAASITALCLTIIGAYLLK